MDTVKYIGTFLKESDRNGFWSIFNKRILFFEWIKKKISIYEECSVDNGEYMKGNVLEIYNKTFFTSMSSHLTLLLSLI